MIPISTLCLMAALSLAGIMPALDVELVHGNCRKFLRPSVERTEVDALPMLSPA
jgi:hypothetical protein